VAAAGAAPEIAWFRRDLRLGDNPALAAAAAGGREVVALFVVDPVLVRPAGRHRLGFLAGCLDELRARTGGALVVRRGDPVDLVAQVAAEVGAAEVHVAADAGPYGRARDRAVADRLARGGAELRRTGSPHAVAPGTLHTRSGTPFQVFTPFWRAWTDHGWEPPRGQLADIQWVGGLRSEPSGLEGASPGAFRPGEEAAWVRLERFLGDVDRYDDLRDRPDLDRTSRLSPFLRFGCLHPRQVLDRLGESRGASAFRRELCWRDFYADVLHHRPDSAREPLRPRLAQLAVDRGPVADERFAAWSEGRTGYPLVDAGMRQLRAEGWMPNRVRMLAASFLVKDLHLPWQRGAREFMCWLVDGDLASNSHGWQWTAGTGTDAAPYPRVFNPTLQAERFDPGGAYVRRWVPELRRLRPPDVHRPWMQDGGPPAGYPAPIVDHAVERAEALARFEAV
jgi:deoxyribodipyrimidine photo-lyase